MKPKTIFYREYDYLGRPEWHYTITGWPPPHERTTSSSGPFRTRKAAETDAQRHIRWFMKVWNKANKVGNPNTIAAKTH